MAFNLIFPQADHSEIIVLNSMLGISNGADSYCRYGNYLLTDTAWQIAVQTLTVWFLDVIISHQQGLENEEFQTWALEREIDLEEGRVGKRSNVYHAICTDGNENELKRQKIPFVNLEFDSYHVWLENGVIFLPEER